MRLKEVLEKEDTEYYRGAALQRFTLTYEVALKAIRAFAKQEGKDFNTDESCFEWAEEKKWLEKKSGWATAIENYKKVKSLPKGKSTGNTYSELRAHYALFNVQELLLRALLLLYHGTSDPAPHLAFSTQTPCALSFLQGASNPLLRDLVQHWRDH